MNEISPDGQWRWDGTQWVPVAEATTPAPPPVASAAKKMGTGKKILIGSAAAVLAIMVLGALGDGDETTATPTATQSSSEDPTEEATPTEEPVVEEPVVEEPVVEEPEEPTLSVSQENAVREAEGYIAYTAFSRSGLIEQLEYEGYSAKDAKFAVDYIDVNWKEQAALEAAEYLDYTSFSRSGLIEQLKYEGYTQKQAEYGATSAGL